MGHNTRDNLGVGPLFLKEAVLFNKCYTCKEDISEIATSEVVLFSDGRLTFKPHINYESD